MLHWTLISIWLAACGSSTPAPRAPEPMDEQEMCERVAERVVDRFVAAATTAWDFPDVPAPEPGPVLETERAMFVTVMFDSCFAEWPAAARSCYLTGSPDASIESCPLDRELRAKAIQRTITILHSVTQ